MKEKEKGGGYDIENAKSQMRKGFLEFPVLLIIGTRASYTSDIVKALMNANLIVVEGTLYPLLSRLRRLKLLEYEWKESKVGPPRKYYKITKEGQNVLKELQTSWKNLDLTVNTLIHKYEKSN